LIQGCLQILRDLRGDHTVRRPKNAPFPLNVLLGNGNGTFNPQPETCAANSSYYYSATPVYPVVADFNGNLDIFIPVLQQGYGAGPDLLEGNGDGTFTPLAGYNVPVPGGGTALLGSGY